MSGFDLKEGNYIEKDYSKQDLWSIIAKMFSSQSRHDTSYKYVFFKSILDNLYNVEDNLMFSFDTIFIKFTEIYWNIILKYNISQKSENKDGRKSYIETILYKASKKYNIAVGIAFEKINQDVKILICKEVKSKCKKNVVGALYGDTEKAFYSFSIQGEWIQLNPIVYSFLFENKLIIEKLNYCEWAKFLEKVNEKKPISNLLLKLDESSKRSDLSVYRKILYNEFEYNNCFYCGKSLSNPKFIEVDHFIPWSYVKDDKLWNLVLSCKDCNRKKSDRLPMDYYLNNILIRNEDMKASDSDLIEMKSYTNEKLIKMYRFAKFNGYGNLWSPKTEN